MARGLVRHALLPGGTGVASLNGSYTTPAAEDHSCISRYWRRFGARRRFRCRRPTSRFASRYCGRYSCRKRGGGCSRVRRRPRSVPATAAGDSTVSGPVKSPAATAAPAGGDSTVSGPVKSPDRGLGTGQWGFHRFRAGQIPGPRPRHRPAGISPFQGRSNPRPTASAPASGDSTARGREGRRRPQGLRRLEAPGAAGRPMHRSRFRRRVEHPHGPQTRIEVVPTFSRTSDARFEGDVISAARSGGPQNRAPYPDSGIRSTE
jgi:hypothetical protein